MIIWSGLGFLVFVLTFLSSLAANLVTNHYAGNETYWDAHRWTFGVALAGAGVLSLIVGLVLHRRGRGRDALFFIPVRYWGPLLMLGGAAVVGVDLFG